MTTDPAVSPPYSSLPAPLTRVRIFLLDGKTIDVGFNMPWNEWLAGQIRVWGGVALDGGYWPMSQVKAIVVFKDGVPPGETPQGDNVVPMRPIR